MTLSTPKKSMATRPFACARRNCDQVGPSDHRPPAPHEMIGNSYEPDEPRAVLRQVGRPRRGAHEEGAVESVLAWHCRDAPTHRGGARPGRPRPTTGRARGGRLAVD